MNAEFRLGSVLSEPLSLSASVLSISIVKIEISMQQTGKVAELPSFSIGFPLAIPVNNFSNRLKL
jgi:hypothetical protein